MVFLIAVYKRVNKFDLGMGDPTANKNHFRLYDEDSQEYQRNVIREK